MSRRTRLLVAAAILLGAALAFDARIVRQLAASRRRRP